MRKMFVVGVVSIIACSLITWIFLLPNWLKRMFLTVFNLVRLLISLKTYTFQHSGKSFTFADLFEEIVKTNPDRVQFIMAENERRVTVSQLDQLANQIAWWLLDLGIKPKDTVALMMQNCPEYVAFWLACAKIGVSCSLINTHMTGKPLLHALEVSLSHTPFKLLVVDNELKSEILADMEDLSKDNIHVYFWDESLELIKTRMVNRPPKCLRKETLERDPFLFIFTSGTTGLPKASKISHSRFYIGSLPYGIMCNLTPRDVVYTTLPLYHSAGGMLGVGSAIRCGCTMVLRKKFSARNFAPDCARYRCTSTQYIGELCRYLLATPSCPEEHNMALSTAFGNGMRPEIWEKFQARFHIGHIVEFYASTEGNLGLFNSCDKVGALGYIPRVLDFLYPVSIVKTDPSDHSKPYRNSKGFGEIAPLGEPGLLIGVIDHGKVDRRFDGYTDGKATNDKIFKNVFHDGDLYFNTGDLITRDFWGFFYWCDRTGDTFRWKGENVSTTQVEQILGECEGVEDVVVYGVQVGQSDGKAGMASITISVPLSDFNWTDLVKTCEKNLPSYARPLFYRIKNNLATTSTFKHVKNDLVKEAFHINQVIDDPLYFYSSRSHNVEILTNELYNDIIMGKIQL